MCYKYNVFNLYYMFQKNTKIIANNIITENTLWFICSFKNVLFILFLSLLFSFSNLHNQHGPRTHDPKVESHTLPTSQSDARTEHFICCISYLQPYNTQQPTS